MSLLYQSLYISAIGISVVFTSLGVLALVIWLIGRFAREEEEIVEEEVAAAVSAAVAAALELPGREDRANWLRNSLSKRRRRR